MTTGLKANSDGSAAIQVGGTDVITLTSGGAATFVTSPTTVQAGTAAAPSITFSGDTNTGIYSPGADTIAFTEGGVESMRLNSSGNLGLGVTPSAWNIGKTFELPNGVSLSANSGLPASYLATNARWNSGWIYTTSAAATYYNQQQGAHAWFNAPSGTAGNAITFTQAMTLSAAGGLSIKRTEDAGSGNILLAADGTIFGNQTSSSRSYIEMYNSTTGNMSLATTFPTAAITFSTGTTPTERARFTNDGRFLVGTTSSSATLTVDAVDALSPGTISSYAISCGNTSGASLGLGSDVNFVYIQSFESKPLLLNQQGNEVRVAGTADNGAYNFQCNGTGVWGAGAYVNGSDERIKEDIAPIASGLDVVTKLNPVTYRYKEDWSKDQSTQTGFIAQELLVAMEGQNYVDGVVQQGGSEGYYSVAYQNIIPLLTKAIQELKAELDATKAEVAALKGA